MISRMLIDPNLKCICIREIQKSLEFSSKQILVDKINAMGYAHFFDIQQNRIKRIGSEGVVTFQGMRDHTAETVKSMGGVQGRLGRGSAVTIAAITGPIRPNNQSRKRRGLVQLEPVQGTIQLNSFSRIMKTRFWSMPTTKIIRS